eukprot:scaffold23_cov356-Pavlova_lutheri.AAC.1
MFEALRKSGAVKGIDLPTPTIFTGEELKKDPYALHRWYKEVSCWVKARVGKEIPQAAMALQTLAVRQDWPWRTGSHLIPDS